MSGFYIEKRDGTKVPYDDDKIFAAIRRALVEVGVQNQPATEMAKEVTRETNLKLDKCERPISVEDIQDIVEIELIKTHPKAGKAYILYRQAKLKRWRKGWKLDELQKDIYESKYRNNEESFIAFVERVAPQNRYIQKAMRDKKFLPAGRVLAGRGLWDSEGRRLSLSNCYVIDRPQDNLESIFDTARNMARTYSYGGGVGVDISNLRPENSPVNNAALTTSGAVSFMDLYSMTTGLIGMKGRRGALMISLDGRHPDIEKFINTKSDLEKVNFANISIRLDEGFFEAIKNEADYELFFEYEDGTRVSQMVDAQHLLDEIAFNMWDVAEPGVLFWDRVKEWSLMSADPDFDFAGVNPCGEQPLPANGACTLSSINLSEFVKEPFTQFATFDWREFQEMTQQGVIYLNDLLDESLRQHPLAEQRESVGKYRQIGLGIFGLADAFIKLGIKYGSQESLNFIHYLGKIMINAALQQSALLAKEHGVAPAYSDKVLQSRFFIQNATEETKGLVAKHGLRNTQLLTVAPTGSTSTMYGASGGVEPLFQISYTRRTLSINEGVETHYKVFSPVVKELMEAQNIKKQEDLPDYVVTTHDITPQDRLLVQSALQKYIDAAISSTLNLDEETSLSQIGDLIIEAHELGLKGVTVFRNNCRRMGILITEDQKEIETKSKTIPTEMKCPECGGDMIVAGGCEECLSCGFSPCSV